MPKGALGVREGIPWISLLEVSAHQHGWALMSDQVHLLSIRVFCTRRNPRGPGVVSRAISWVSCLAAASTGRCMTGRAKAAAQGGL